MPDLVITGIGLPPAAIRGVTQTLEPIQAAAQAMRTVNGALVDVSAAAFRKYASAVSCRDKAPPALSGVWPGQQVTVDCVAELVYETATGAAERTVVASRVDGAFTFYRPRLTMRVLSFRTERDEWGAAVGWSMALEEGMSFHFAWVEPAETTFGVEHQREDEEVFALEVAQDEGEFAVLTIDIRNPRRRLLDGTDIWAWLSQDGTPIFFGRLIAVPEELAAEIVRMTFTARPAGFDATKRALADTLKVAPYWDPVWILDERIDDPDTVLEARPALWHVDRVTHAVTISDILRGEDGTVNFGPADVEYESLDVSHGAPPVRRVRVDAEIAWDEAATGEIDVSAEMLAAFAAAGSTGGLVTSFTGQGLAEDWPEAGTALGGGWSIGTATLQRADGVWKTARYVDVVVEAPRDPDEASGLLSLAVTAAPVIARFYLWEFLPSFVLAYDVARQRIERVAFTLTGDVQRVYTEPGEEEEIVLALASRKVSEEIDGAAPIGDPRRKAYLKTDRGRQSLDYLVALARARLLARARAVEIRFDVTFAAGLQLSCRKDVLLTDDRLPDGQAAGKITGYRLTASGDGRRRAEVRIGCTIGEGATVAAAPGAPSYVEDGYMENLQVRTGETIMPVAGEVTYADISGTPVDDDGIDFFALSAADVLRRLDVINGEGAQRAALAARFPDIEAAVEAVNAVFTEVWLELVPLVGGPFVTTYDVVPSTLMVPRTITL